MSDSGSNYGWLYESNQQNQATTPGGPTLPPPNLPPPGGMKPTKKKRHPIRWTLSLVLALLLGWLVFLVAVPYWAYTKINRVEAFGDWARPAQQPGQTVLIVGTDKRTGETANGRTDTIMMLHWGSGPTTLTSFPRDSLVDIPGYGSNKINAAYSWGGPELLVETVENATGIRIDGYVEIGFTGLTDVVDAVGGITICPKQDISDPSAWLNPENPNDGYLNIKEGCQEVDGATALAYTRSRHTYSIGDIGRAEAQREVIAAVGTEILKTSTFLNPVRYVSVASTGAESVSINNEMGFIFFGQFAYQLATSMSGSGLSCTVPLSTISGWSNGQSVVLWDEEKSGQFFDDIAADKTDQLGDLCSPTGGI